MAVFFVSTRTHPIDDPNIIIIDTLEPVKQYLDNLEVIGYDKEFNGLNHFYAIPLLTAVGDEHNQFIIDDYSFPDLSWLNPYRKREFIGHNIKIDLLMSSHQGFWFERVYDTMIVEQRVGLDSKRLNNLEATYERRLLKPLPQDKSVRDDFLLMKRGSVFQNKHIIYTAYDISVLFSIKEVQKRYIDLYNMHFLLYSIEFPLVAVTASMELEGINIDEKKWEKNIDDSKKELLKLERELDDELRLLGYKIPIRNRVEVIQPSLFGDQATITQNKNLRHISYSSPLQIQKIFNKLGLTIPTKTDKTSKDKITGRKTYEDKNSVQEDALNTYLLDNPRSPLKSFLLKYIEFKGVEKQINAFGYKFIRYEVVNKTKKRSLGYKNRITGRVHTSYRQCFTKTGRFASGDALHGFFNSQQIPAEKKFRTPFTLSQEEIDEGWVLVTSDLTGAETVIMCAFAKDENLKRWALENDDLHSPMATKCWKAVYEYRKKMLGSLSASKTYYQINDLKQGSYTLTEDFLIDKNTNKQLRTDFKSVTFAVIYRAERKTISKYLNIPEGEAQVIIDTIKITIPDTFRMVDEAISMALHTARVVHNTRTNSHKWFIPALKGFSRLDRSEISTISGEASNCRIQGTQADMVKEAMVVLYRFAKLNGIQMKFVFQVHDELVIKVKGREYAHYVPKIMGRTATKYLEGFTQMKAEEQVLTHWNK